MGGVTPPLQNLGRSADIVGAGFPRPTAGSTALCAATNSGWPILRLPVSARVRRRDPEMRRLNPCMDVMPLPAVAELSRFQAEVDRLLAQMGQSLGGNGFPLGGRHRVEGVGRVQVPAGGDRRQHDHGDRQFILEIDVLQQLEAHKADTAVVRQRPPIRAIRREATPGISERS